MLTYTAGEDGGAECARVCAAAYHKREHGIDKRSSSASWCDAHAIAPVAGMVTYADVR